MQFNNIKNRVERLEIELTTPPYFSRVVCLYDGETKQDAHEQLIASNGGVMPPPAASGPNFIIIRIRRERPSKVRDCQNIS